MTSEVPGFHHLHLRATDPETAVAFYTRRFPESTKRTLWGGEPALYSDNNVLLLFEKVASSPPASPQTAFWHFGWYVLDTRLTMEAFKQEPDVEFWPLYTGDGDGQVLVSSDTWPGAPGSLGRTRAQIEEAKAQNVEPTRKGGFGYIHGPDGAMIEYAGNQPQQRMNHVHMYQEDPFCAQLWYQTHFNAPLFRGGRPDVTWDGCVAEQARERSFPALEPEGMFRGPQSAVEFGDVAFMWYMRQGTEPLVSTRGQLYDHVALSVKDLDAWLSKLRGEGLHILQEPYPLGETRAFMVEGPSLEAIELVEVK